MIRRLSATAGLAVGALLTQVVGASACGGLIAPNGSIRLTHASTVVDWRDGVEHYLTSFSYQGAGFSDFGFVVPLPAAPDRVEEGGGWTLQRLDREVHPLPRFGFAADLAAGAPAPQVLQTVQVKALDITVLKGTGDELVAWCGQNHYLLDAETRAHLLNYAKGSPFFMAAKFNAARAQASSQLVGDGTPVLITMHTPHLWVPLEILANGVSQVNADVYLLTRGQVFTSDLAAADGESPAGSLIPHAPGVTVPVQEQVSPQLYHDLSSDKNMGWVEPDSWLTYVRLFTPASTVDYDLGLSSNNVIHVAAFGTRPALVPDGHHDLGATIPSAPAAQPGLQPGVATLLVEMFLALAIMAGVMYVSRSRGPRLAA